MCSLGFAWITCVCIITTKQRSTLYARQADESYSLGGGGAEVSDRRLHGGVCYRLLGVEGWGGVGRGRGVAPMWTVMPSRGYLYSGLL